MAEISEQAKLCFGCVSSSASANRYRSKSIVENKSQDQFLVITNSTCNIIINFCLSCTGKFRGWCTSMAGLCGCKCSRSKHWYLIWERKTNDYNRTENNWEGKEIKYPDVMLKKSYRVLRLLRRRKRVKSCMCIDA